MGVRRIAALGLLVLATAPAQAQSSPPNFLVIQTDDQRADTLVHMRQLQDRLVAGGIDFVRAYAPSSLCCPSRASSFTGRYAHNTGVFWNTPPWGGAPLFDSSTSFIVDLDAAGYRTGLFGKYLNDASAISGTPEGWDDFRYFPADGFNYFDYDMIENGEAVHYGTDAEDYSTTVTKDQTLRFIEDAVAHGEPFAAFWHPYAPHFDRFWECVPHPDDVGAFSHLPPADAPSYREEDMSDKHPFVFNPTAAIWDAVESEGNLENLRRTQRECLLAVDRGVGELLDQLEALGVLANTYVFFYSDNGHIEGEHNRVGKNVPYEESMRIPFAVAGPGITSGVRHHLVLNIDIAPTILELSGLVPRGDGQSLVRLFRRDLPAYEWRGEFLTQHVSPNPPGLLLAFMKSASSIGLRYEGFNLILYDDGFEELYDLTLDSHEMQSVSNDPDYAYVKGYLSRIANAMRRNEFRQCDRSDYTGDGIVGGLDLQRFRAGLATCRGSSIVGTECIQYDLDYSGLVDGADRRAFAHHLDSCSGRTRKRPPGAGRARGRLGLAPPAGSGGGR